MVTLYEIIEKEAIRNLVFPGQEVLETPDAINSRNNQLNRALLLGNLEHLKTKIYFEDSVSRKVVETTIWGVTENQVILKQGTVIPIHRIYKSQ